MKSSCPGFVISTPSQGDVAQDRDGGVRASLSADTLSLPYTPGQHTWTAPSTVEQKQLLLPLYNITPEKCHQHFTIPLSHITTTNLYHLIIFWWLCGFLFHGKEMVEAIVVKQALSCSMKNAMALWFHNFKDVKVCDNIKVPLDETILTEAIGV